MNGVFDERLVLIVVAIGSVGLFLLLFFWRLRRRYSAQNDSLRKTLKEVSDYKVALDESAIVAITDHKGIITHVNDNFCRISKYSRSELIGQDHRIINSAYHSKEFFKNLWSTIASGNVWKGEIRNRAKDGTFYWVDTSIVPFIRDGKPFQYLPIRSDITERRTAEDVKAANRRLGAEIQEKNAQLSSFLDRITDAFVTLDKNFSYTYVNKKAGEMAQSEPGRMIGRNVWELFPELRDSPTHIAFTEAMRDQRYVDTMDYYPPLDVWFESHVYPSEDGLSVFIRDVTKQMKAEKTRLETVRLYQTIASAIPGLSIVILDQEYRFVLAEGEMLARLGYAKQLILDKKAVDVVPTDRYEEQDNYFRKAFNGEAFSIEVRRNNYDLLTKYVPLYDEHNEIYSIMIASMDVTALKDAERKVAELNVGLEERIAERTAQLEAVNKDLEAFSYSVAHDLRAPLRAVSSYATIFREEYAKMFDEESDRLITKIERNADRMSLLIDDLLKFSRLGRKEVRRSVVDMKILFEEVLEQMSAGKAEIRFGTMHPVFGDRSLLMHVVENLLSNAIKYSSRKDHPEVTISSEARDNTITYSISDNGVGFDMRYVEQMFGVFKRLHANEDFEGTGVGLAIVQRIVKGHDGKVWAHSKVNEGATFFFTLPAIPSGS